MRAIEKKMLNAIESKQNFSLSNTFVKIDGNKAKIMDNFTIYNEVSDKTLPYHLYNIHKLGYTGIKKNLAKDLFNKISDKYNIVLIFSNIETYQGIEYQIFLH